MQENNKKNSLIFKLLLFDITQTMNSYNSQLCIRSHTTNSKMVVSIYGLRIAAPIGPYDLMYLVCNSINLFTMHYFSCNYYIIAIFHVTIHKSFREIKLEL